MGACSSGSRGSKKGSRQINTVQQNDNTAPKSFFQKMRAKKPENQEQQKGQNQAISETPKKDETKKPKQDLNYSELMEKELNKMPKTGSKVQEAYIATVKRAIGVDLTPARTNEKWFDTRTVFNVDVRRLPNKSIIANERILKEIEQLNFSPYINKYFDADIMSNGAYRYAIVVRNKLAKK